MTKDTPNGEGMSPHVALTIAEKHFWRALQALEEHLQEKEADAEISGQQVAKATADIRKAMQTIFDERVKVDQFRTKISGVAGGSALDLERARFEIGRRLSCLRQSRRSGTISGKS